MITMLLGGLWHGASWNFVIWGALHGVALAGTRMWQRSGSKKPSYAQASRFQLPHVLALFLTFNYVCFAWIFFRAPSFAHATLMLSRIARLTFATENISAKVVVMLVVAMLVHFIPRDWENRLRDRFALTPSLVQGILLAAAAYGVHLAAGAKAEPFVYGQF
jgi:alginate O-acetyltransferase complex protein AlgI